MYSTIICYAPHSSSHSSYGTLLASLFLISSLSFPLGPRRKCWHRLSAFISRVSNHDAVTTTVIEKFITYQPKGKPTAWTSECICRLIDSSCLTTIAEIIAGVVLCSVCVLSPGWVALCIASTACQTSGRGKLCLWSETWWVSVLISLYSPDEVSQISPVHLSLILAGCALSH